MVLAEADQDWAEVAENARRSLAVNPLRAAPHRFLARACEELGQADQAIRAYQILLRLDPLDPAEAHFRLGRLLYQRGDPDARRHVVQALEEAPRYREAHRLLLDIVNAP